MAKPFCDECQFCSDRSDAGEALCLHLNAQNPPSRTVKRKNAYRCSVHNFMGKCRDFARVSAGFTHPFGEELTNASIGDGLKWLNQALPAPPVVRRYRGSRYASPGLRR